MGLSYSDVRKFDKKVSKILRRVDSLVVVEQENVTLRARVAELEAQIAAAVDSTDAVEARARGGLPASS